MTAKYWSPKVGYSIALQHRQRSEHGLQCFYCNRTLVSGLSGYGKNRATIDHIVTRSNGGNHNPDNLIIACMDCNMVRGDLEINKWLELIKVIRGLSFEEIKRELHEILERPINEEMRLQLDRIARKNGNMYARNFYKKTWG